VNAAAYRIDFEGKPEVFGYVQRGRWATLADDGTRFIACPILNQKRTACEFRLVEIRRGSGARLSPLGDPLESKAAAALVELAHEAFPLVTTKRTPRFNAERAAFSHAGIFDARSVPAWKVAVCLYWPFWERNGTPWGERARELFEAKMADKSSNTLLIECRRLGLC
jgi:hypothetical protein